MVSPWKPWLSTLSAIDCVRFFLLLSSCPDEDLNHLTCIVARGGDRTRVRGHLTLGEYVVEMTEGASALHK